MKYRAQGRSALETRVDYVEGNLDKAITSFKEANARSESRLDGTIKDFKEAIKDNKQAMQQMERDLKATLEKSIDKAESSRRWAIGSVITVAIAIIGFILTNI